MFRETYPLTNISQCLGQHSVSTSLSTKGFTDNHEPVTNNHHLVDLQDLVLEDLGTLQVHLSTVLLDGWSQHRVVRFGEYDSREQIRRDTLEEKEEEEEEEEEEAV